MLVFTQGTDISVNRITYSTLAYNNFAITTNDDSRLLVLIVRY
jgi:hypothetical protein